MWFSLATPHKLGTKHNKTTTTTVFVTCFLKMTSTTKGASPFKRTQSPIKLALNQQVKIATKCRV